MVRVIQKNILVVGNPGKGKSTILNGLIGSGKIHFRSGVSIGKGLTYQFQTHRQNGICYMDTPGLSDIVVRKKAAAAIEQALKKGGKYQIFFVVTLESGRVQPDDIATIDTILSAITVPIQFGIIVNKVSHKIMKRMGMEFDERRGTIKLNNEGKSKRDLLPASLNSGKMKTGYICCYPFNKGLADEDNVYKPAPKFLKEFVKLVPANSIQPRNVKPITVNKRDSLRREFSSRMNRVRRDNQVLQKSINKLSQEKKEMATVIKTKQQQAVQSNQRIQQLTRQVQQARSSSNNDRGDNCTIL